MTSSNGNFSALLAICAGNSPVPGEFPAQSPVTRSFDVSLICRINGWVNNREAGDLRRIRTHYDVIVMLTLARKPMLHQQKDQQLPYWSIFIISSDPIIMMIPISLNPWRGIHMVYLFQQGCLCTLWVRTFGAHLCVLEFCFLVGLLVAFQSFFMFSVVLFPIQFLVVVLCLSGF